MPALAVRSLAAPSHSLLCDKIGPFRVSLFVWAAMAVTCGRVRRAPRSHAAASESAAVRFWRCNRERVELHIWLTLPTSGELDYTVRCEGGPRGPVTAPRQLTTRGQSSKGRTRTTRLTSIPR